MGNLKDKEATKATNNFVVQAVQCGTPQQSVLTSEQAEAVRAQKASAPPATPSLVKALTQARKFPFVTR